MNGLSFIIGCWILGWYIHVGLKEFSSEKINRIRKLNKFLSKEKELPEKELV